MLSVRNIVTMLACVLNSALISSRLFSPSFKLVESISCGRTVSISSRTILLLAEKDWIRSLVQFCQEGICNARSARAKHNCVSIAELVSADA